MNLPAARSAASFSASIPLKILLVDDDEEFRGLMTAFLSARGHRVRWAANGHEALSAFQTDEPDVVLIDKNMPVMDGHELVGRLKQLLGERWLPLIMMSVDADHQLHIEALRCGCDDYLAKPINFELLDAKLHSFRRVANLQRQLVQQRSELDRFYEQTEEEALLIGEIMQRLTHAHRLAESGIRHFIEPTKHFSGDLVAATRSPQGELYVMLADASGHGLSAAMLLIPAVQTFYAMAGKGFQLDAIAEEMNGKLRPYAVIGNFVAAALIRLRPEANAVEVWNGGLPPAVFVDQGGAIRRLFVSHNFPLGAVGGPDFSNIIESFHYDGDGQLIAFSDGLIEAEDAYRRPFGMARLLETLRIAPRQARLNRLRSHVDAHCKGYPKHDDVSCVVVECPRTTAVDADLPQNPTPIATKSQWSITLTLTAPQLKAVDLMPLLVDWAKAMGLSPEASSRFFLVMSELYNNALEHGVLALDSTLKQSDQGWDDYIAEREARLARLNEGEIEIQLEQLIATNGARLRIRVRDSGPGFDYRQVNELPNAELMQQAGYGLGLIRHYCLRLDYFGKGNVVEAELAC